MRGYEAVRDRLYSNSQTYQYLDAAQLIKHALAMRTEVHKLDPPNSHLGKRPVLVYLYAEPTAWGRPPQQLIPSTEHIAHDTEVKSFASTVKGDEVEFVALTYRQVLTGWAASDSRALRDHVAALRERFLV